MLKGYQNPFITLQSFKRTSKKLSKMFTSLYTKCFSSTLSSQFISFLRFSFLLPHPSSTNCTRTMRQRFTLFLTPTSVMCLQICSAVNFNVALLPHSSACLRSCSHGVWRRKLRWQHNRLQLPLTITAGAATDTTNTAALN